MDSTMMWIVHQAMNNAHEKMQSKEGVLERLNGISRFYELAAMQLEGCLKFVRQETDSYTLESSYEQLLEDLSEIRTRLQRRLKESEMAIKAKDLELASLLRSSSTNVKIERRTRSEPIEECILNNRLSGDDDEDDGDGGDDRDNEFFSELKNSVDQQVSNIRQKLEPDYKDKEGNPEVVEGVNNKRIEQMGSDMWILKKTLDLAFGKMQNAIFKFDVGPIEQQWRCTVEKDTMSILLKGCMTDFQEKENQVSLGLKEYWSDLMNEVANLRCDLESFVGQNEVEAKCVDWMSIGGKKHSPEDFSHGKPEKQWSLKKQRSLKAEDLMQGLREEKTEEEEGHYVSKMIKNHESIIRMKSAEAEELNLLKREILRQKLNLSSRREEMGMQENSLKRKVQEIILTLDKLRDWDAKLGETFNNCKFHHEEETLSENRFLKSDASREENLELDTLEDVWEKMEKLPYAVNELQNEGTRAKQEQEEEVLRAMIMDKTYVTLLEGMLEENCTELHDYELENTISNDICKVLLAEMVNQWKENSDGNNIESRYREEIYCTVIREAIKDYGSNGKIGLVKCQDLRAENSTFLEGTIREDVCWTLLQEMFKEWNECIDGHETESVFRQEIDWLTISETVKDVVKTASDQLDQCRDSVTTKFLQSAESFIREDVYTVFIRETMKQWKMDINALKMESLVREEIYQFVTVEAFKDACVLFSEAEPGNQEKISNRMLSANKLRKGTNVNAEENLNEKIDVEDNLVLSASSEELITKGHTFGLVSSKLAIKARGSQLGSSLGTSVDGSEKIYNRVSPAVVSADYREPFHCQSEANEEIRLNSSGSMSAPALRISLELADFEHRTNEKLEMNCLRLDKMKDRLDTLVKLVSSLRKKESVYQDAFTRRCHNLWKAETEVDLLGDQVDVLVGLLEKTYTTLHHHSPVLQQFFEVSDILRLIKKELNRVVNASKN
ncbi:hypothetical protein ACFX19_041818 [Malus domestica]|uniref:WPP domain-associated protein n=1 Tax=Malus domestica TaxID=3750 RepID=UPI003977165B